MRAVYPNSTTFPLYLHDGFKLDRFSNYLANRTDFVVQDHHSYFVFTPQDESEPAAQHTSDVETNIADSLQAASDRLRRNLVIDEFSCALTDDSLKDEDDPEEARREFCTGQMQVYANATAGWAFWCKFISRCQLMRQTVLIARVPLSIQERRVRLRLRLVLHKRRWQESSLQLLLIWGATSIRTFPAASNVRLHERIQSVHVRGPRIPFHSRLLWLNVFVPGYFYSCWIPSGAQYANVVGPA